MRTNVRKRLLIALVHEVASLAVWALLVAFLWSVLGDVFAQQLAPILSGPEPYKAIAPVMALCGLGLFLLFGCRRLASSLVGMVTVPLQQGNSR